MRGTITDANDGHAGAGRDRDGAPGDAVVRQINADGNGAYAMHLPVGAYTIEATATNYSVESPSVNVTLNAERARPTSRCIPGAPPSHRANIQLTVPVNQSRTPPADAVEHRLGAA